MFVTVYPCGGDVPNVSALNFAPGLTVANGAQATLAANGTMCVYSMASTHLIIDISGYWAK